MVQLKSTKTDIATKEEQATKRREQLRLASQRYRLRQKAKLNFNTLEHEPAAQLDDEEVLCRKAARKKTAASYYKRNQETIRRKANDKYVRNYIRNNGLDTYDARFVPRRTKEALALAREQGDRETLNRNVQIEENGDMGMGYLDLVRSIAVSMKAQREQRRAKGTA
ncbi:hypothetical protein BT96DRAFT_1008476 [Gymnopus androsaceus JB14]|uniref:Uncharacterized protein n=1 Tax=Gymnopus androsaceus JB14 TaxID=1447944 RepID=A0A6A4GER5_9AGAR|nr:hypothetical protein BT96DRAFT_1008476 [Gymnopus androsaceus JB14]